MMKKLLATLGCLTAMTLASVPQTATATTRIVFPKGSYCGSYSGDFRNSKTFSIYLAKGQSFSIESNNPMNSVIVRDSRGIKRGYWSGGDTYYDLVTRTKGTHNITIKTDSSYEDVKFCAY